MTRREYAKLTARQMQERRYRLTRLVESGTMAMPAGMEVRILGKCAGSLDVAAPKCQMCGVSAYMRRVPLDAVEEIPE